MTRHPLLASAIVLVAFWYLAPGVGLSQKPGDPGTSSTSQPSAAPQEVPPENSIAPLGGHNFKPSATGASRFKGLIGYALLIGLAFALCRNRQSISWRAVGWGLALQFLFALIVLNPAVSTWFFAVIDRFVGALLSFAQAGIEFTFQTTSPHQITVVNPDGSLAPRTIVGTMSPPMKSVAFWVLPTVVFFSSMVTMLYHLGVMQHVVRVIAQLMMHATRTSGAETLSATANIFVGQTEAPLVVKPYIGRMTQSELFAVMTGGFATVAGGVLALYVSFLQGVPGIAGHLVTASLMAAPCALAVSKLIYPETEVPATAGMVETEIKRVDANVIEAIARGASEGIYLAINIAAMLVAFVAIVALVNFILGIFGSGFTLERLLGWIFSPIAWSIGVPWHEATHVGQLLGEKLVLTELIAFLHLKDKLTLAPALLSRRSAIISAYSLCGFANVASIGVQIGGIGAMAPERRGDLSRLGLRAMFAGMLVSCLSGAIAGVLT